MIFSWQFSFDALDLPLHDDNNQMLLFRTSAILFLADQLIDETNKSQEKKKIGEF